MTAEMRRLLGALRCGQLFPPRLKPDEWVFPIAFTLVALAYGFYIAVVLFGWGP